MRLAREIIFSALGLVHVAILLAMLHQPVLAKGSVERAQELFVWWLVSIPFSIVLVLIVLHVLCVQLDKHISTKPRRQKPRPTPKRGFEPLVLHRDPWHLPKSLKR
jgi:hypothetical protein